MVIIPRRVTFLTTEKKITFIGNKGVLTGEDKTAGLTRPFTSIKRGEI